jgi:hypothetical protein
MLHQVAVAHTRSSVSLIEEYRPDIILKTVNWLYSLQLRGCTDLNVPAATHGLSNEHMRFKIG